jgi:hypothetical protein
MGANAQTTVPTFTAGEVLTAAQMNQSARTGVPVFADTTERDAAFGGTGEKTLAEGQLCYLESTNVVQYYDGSTWATVGPTTAGGLVFITSATVTASSAANINNCFTSTYDNYRILIDTTAISNNATNLLMRLRVSGTDATTNYTAQRLAGEGASTFASSDESGTDDWWLCPADDTYPNSPVASIDLYRPFLAAATKGTVVNGGETSTGTNVAGVNWLLNTNATSYDGFSIFPGAGTFSGNIYVYGYAK